MIAFLVSVLRGASPRSSVTQLLALGAVLTLASSVPSRLTAQTVRVEAQQEAFRQTPNGKRLGTVMQGAELHVLGRQGGWTHVQLAGSIWSNSVVPTKRDGFDLVVSAANGENLRDRPGGRVLARLLQGFLLKKSQEGQSWIRVSRTGWVWGPSLAAATPTEKPAPPPKEGPPRAPVAGRPGAPRSGSAAQEKEKVIVDAPQVHLRVSPRSDTVAVLERGVELEILDRREGWARVRLEGWVPTGELSPADPDSTLAELSAADLKANPDQYRGRRVRWSVQFISLEKAESVRKDFYEGEPFILARAPDPSEGFVYVAVPAGLLPKVERLRGLQTIEVVASVRTGRSTLMGVPILDLLAIYQ